MKTPKQKIDTVIEDLLEVRNTLTLERDILALRYEIKQLETALANGDISSEESDGDPL